ncbi:hypothetical protein [Streptomyces sp. WAC07061]|nr:hypothetical protein [Streptomyces sp. WAC07061]
MSIVQIVNIDACVIRRCAIGGARESSSRRFDGRMEETART